MNKIISNVDTAQDSASRIRETEVSQGHAVTIGRSNINSVRAGACVANHLLSDMRGMTDCVKKQSERFTDIAEFFDRRDSQISSEVRGNHARG